MPKSVDRHVAQLKHIIMILSQPVFALSKIKKSNSICIFVTNLNCLTCIISFQVATIVGGMSIQKQQRILKKKPEIVVATPGRLWELFQMVCTLIISF